ncbi:Peptidase_C54 domain-containing protein [Cephalotus follicularis]|uniref:Cysteine protease n=1 Tax=Cephalotus follicularis TaxID=3775 RepID=A0A1Q3D940_CEPFO|nr:Peptidase_C54 domain-containing protein [Cephalotus follicularis]
MKLFRDRFAAPESSSRSSTNTPNTSSASVCSEPGIIGSKLSKASLLSTFLAYAFSSSGTYSESSDFEKKEVRSRNIAWKTALKRAVSSGSMRRVQELVLGTSKTGITNSTSVIWLLGVSYKISQDEPSRDAATSNGLAEFKLDFSSRILFTYRKGFDAIGDSKFTSDVHWGCMLRSSQMLIAQALLFHQLGRSWRKCLHKPIEQEYIEILHLFGDSEASTLSIHNLVQAGKVYGLAAGSWVGPYAVCRSWESLVCHRRTETDLEHQSLPMAVYVVSGDEDGERGGAPVVCIEDAARHCHEFSKGQTDWSPIVLLVPLVLGLEKVNPRYISLLQATFTFPQSLGILGGKPGVSTYIVGVQEENAFYLDPHEVQPVVNISRNDLEADTSSYHCNIIRHMPLDSIDPSLAIGFYCQDKDDFDDFCCRASKLADESNGAPLFTVSQTRHLSNRVSHGDTMGNISGVQEDDFFGVVPTGDAEDSVHEDDWQLL